MNTNFIKDILGNTFTAEKNIGNQLEVLLGGTINSNPGADLGFWEVKSRRNGTSSAVSLGSKRTDNINEVAERVYNKVQNVIMIDYTINDNGTFTVDMVTLCWGLNKESFMAEIGKMVKIELHKGQTVLRTSHVSFKKLYGKKVIEYTK